MNIHVLGGNKNGSIVTYRVVFHIPVPDELNSAGVSLRAAICRYEDTVSAVSDITAEEQGMLNAGQVYEDELTFMTHVNGTGYEQALIDWYNQRKVALLDELRDQFKLSGLTQDIPA